MKSKIFFLLLILASISLTAQTVIHDGQEVSGKWTKTKSPYIIEGEAIVPDGETLTIKPGTEIQFKTGDDFDYRYEEGDLNPNFNVGCIRVEGTIIAKGKKNKFITFKGTDKYGNWGNVFMINSKDNIFEYCHIEAGHFMRLVTTDDNATGCISFINSSGTVKNCIITRGWTGINCKQGSMPEIINCTIVNNEYGIEANSNSKPNVVNTIIWNNGESFYINPGASIKISYSLIQDDFQAEGLYDKGKNIYGENPELESDFKLRSSSPCIKAGDKGINIGVLH